MKRILAILFSIYIITLLVAPCADVHENICHKTQDSTHSLPESHESGCDCCSPFCTCNCCVSPVPVQVNFIYFNNYFVIKQQYLSINTLSVPAIVFGSIWQPPRYC
ncbi:MAG: DUF6660 family protein [Paludibacteraceae bacterium]